MAEIEKSTDKAINDDDFIESLKDAFLQYQKARLSNKKTQHDAETFLRDGLVQCVLNGIAWDTQNVGMLLTTLERLKSANLFPQDAIANFSAVLTLSHYQHLSGIDISDIIQNIDNKIAPANHDEVFYCIKKLMAGWMIDALYKHGASKEQARTLMEKMLSLSKSTVGRSYNLFQNNKDLFDTTFNQSILGAGFYLVTTEAPSYRLNQKEYASKAPQGKRQLTALYEAYETIREETAVMLLEQIQPALEKASNPLFHAVLSDQQYSDFLHGNLDFVTEEKIRLLSIVYFINLLNISPELFT